MYLTKTALFGIGSKNKKTGPEFDYKPNSEDRQYLQTKIEENKAYNTDTPTSEMLANVGKTSPVSSGKQPLSFEQQQFHKQINKANTERSFGVRPGDTQQSYMQRMRSIGRTPMAERRWSAHEQQQAAQQAAPPPTAQQAAPTAPQSLSYSDFGTSKFHPTSKQQTPNISTQQYEQIQYMYRDLADQYGPQYAQEWLRNVVGHYNPSYQFPGA